MQHNPSSEVSSFPVIKNRRLFWKSKVYYHDSQDPATGPYSELDESNTYRYILFLDVHFNNIFLSLTKYLSGMFALGFPAEGFKTDWGRR
jgi:hypothetical protein